MKKQLSEREIITLQIQAYDFYAGLIGRAVVSGANDAKMPRWDEQRALEYRELANQLRRRLAEIEAEDPIAADATPGVVPVPTTPQPVSPEAGSATIGNTTSVG